MSGMLGNYACPLLVLDFSSSLQQLHMMHTVEEEAAASFFFSCIQKKSIIYKQLTYSYLNWIGVYLEHYTQTPPCAFQGGKYSAYKDKLTKWNGVFC